MLWQLSLTFLQRQECDGSAETTTTQAYQVRLLRLHLQPLARVNQVQGAILQEEREGCSQCLQLLQAQAAAKLLVLLVQAGAKPGHSYMRAGPQRAEVSCCRSRRSPGLGLHLRGSKLPGTQLNWLCHRSPKRIGVRQGWRAVPATLWALRSILMLLQGRGPAAPHPHLDDGLDSAGRAGGGPAGCLHGACLEMPGTLGHGLLPEDTEHISTTLDRALPYFSCTSQPS